MKNRFTLYLAASALVFMAGVLYFTYRSGEPDVRQHSGVPDEYATGRADTTDAENPVPDGMKRYRNPRFHFRLDYPEDMSATDSIEGGALTVVFEADDGRGFQIYALPYIEPTVSKERFKMDNPSGVMKDPVDITVDGAPAQMFFSTNVRIGETREVWFINAGVLYEVNTYKDLDAWLSEIMRTWRFI